MTFGFNEHVEEVAQVQALRAAPPGEAADDPDRARVFGAALQQFEELLTAAGAVGSASAPLPLFYALSQAGRAIAAARCSDDRWDFAGHGLKVPEDHQNIGQTSVKPNPRGKDAGDAFSVVADATGSGRLTAAVALESLWASLPDVETADGLGQRCSTAQHLAPQPYRRDATAGDLRLPNEDVPDPYALARYLQPYPSAAEFQVVEWGEVFLPSEHRKDAVIILQWANEDGVPRLIRDVCETYLGDMDTYLWPAVGPKHDVLSPLMTWWAVLLALSSLARYAPAAWTAALDRDSSPLAVPIEAGLRRARRIMPRMVRHAITGSWL